MCKHWGEINYFGESPKNGILYGFHRCCKFFKHKTGKYYHAHTPSQLACENFEEKQRLRRTIQSQKDTQGYVCIGNIDRNFMIGQKL